VEISVCAQKRLLGYVVRFMSVVGESIRKVHDIVAVAIDDFSNAS